MRRVILFIFSERAVWGVGGGGYAARLFLLFSFPCSADHERDWPPCKVVFCFFGLATNTLNVRNNNNNNNNNAEEARVTRASLVSRSVTARQIQECYTAVLWATCQGRDVLLQQLKSVAKFRRSKLKATNLRTAANSTPRTG